MIFSSGEKSSSVSKTLLFCDILATSHCQTINISKSYRYLLSKSYLLDIFIVWQWLVAEISQNYNVFDTLELFSPEEKVMTVGELTFDLFYPLSGLCSTHESWVKFDLLTQMSLVRVESAVKISDMSRVRVESCRSSFESEMNQLNTAWVKVELLIFLTRAWPGGGVWRPPLPNIRDSSKTNSAIDVKLGRPSHTTIWHRPWKFFWNPSEIFWDMVDFCDVTTRHFSVENWPNFAGLWKTQFLIKRKWKTPKDVKWEALQDGYLGFSKVWVFDP